MKEKKSLIVKICVSAILIALEIVLNRFCSINTTFLKVGFAFVPPAFAAIVFGPATGAAVYALADMLGALLFPMGPYHPGFTACAALMGAVYGFFLCKTPVNINHLGKNGSFTLSIRRNTVPIIPNVAVAVLINCIVFGLFINTAWISMLYDTKTYWGYFLSRIIEYAILIPVQIAIIPILLKISGPVRKITGAQPEGGEEKQ